MNVERMPFMRDLDAPLMREYCCANDVHQIDVPTFLVFTPFLLIGWLHCVGPPIQIPQALVVVFLAHLPLAAIHRITTIRRIVWFPRDN